MTNSIHHIKEGAIIEKLKNGFEEGTDLLECQIVVDAFRQCGFLQVLANRIANINEAVCDKEDFSQILSDINEAIERRTKPSPHESHDIGNRLNSEMRFVYRVQSKLLELIQNDAKRKNQSDSLRQLYEGFIGSVNLVTDNALPYVVRHNDPFIQEHGTILLESQGLMIQVGALSDRLGLHTAYIAPKKSFGHLHSSGLVEKPNWEYHFVYPGKEGSHVVDNYRCDMDKANGDIVGVPINLTHGGMNYSDSPMELHFCAGGEIPWDYPPKDLQAYDVDKSVPVENLKLLNGIPLESTLNKAAKGIQTLLNPITLEGDYGIELQSLVVEDEPFSFTSTGEVAQVWSGQGSLSVVGTEMKNSISRADKFALLPGIEYRIEPQQSIILLKFIMKDFQ